MDKNKEKNKRWGIWAIVFAVLITTAAYIYWLVNLDSPFRRPLLLWPVTSTLFLAIASWRYLNLENQFRKPLRIVGYGIIITSGVMVWGLLNLMIANFQNVISHGGSLWFLPMIVAAFFGLSMVRKSWNMD